MNVRLFISGAFLLLGLFASRAAAYTLYGAKWTTSTVSMQLQLGASSGVLLDGASSWGAAAEETLSVWNSYIGAMKFSVVRDSTAARTAGNRLNNVYFSNDVSGQAWGSGVLAVTLLYSSGASQIETDVLFNNRVSWNSYRGPLRTSGAGTPLYDFRRVALHEFGHALGLNHPDEAGQSVTALMNSQVSALDELTADDIAGGQFLYGPATSVAAPPIITSNPASRSVTVGQSVTFGVTANSSTPVSYQWMKSGALLSGATSSSFSLANVSLADAGTYTAVVSNAGGSVTSTAATLTVAAAPPPPPSPPPPALTAPSVLVAPTSQVANAGTTVSMHVVESGSAPLFYQWRKDGGLVPGAASTSLSLSNVQPAHAGSYSVTVSNAAGTTTSSPAVLTVQTPPSISTAPADQSVAIGGRIRLSVIATGSAPLSYAWRKDGTLIPGAHDSVYEIAAAELSDAGSYTVVVTGAAGSVTSPSARVAVVAVAPSIASGPAAQTVTAGGSATFSVVANGTPPFTYQWFKDAQEIPGATSSIYTLRPIRPGDAGDYSVRISNQAGSVTVAAALTVRSSRLINLSTRALIPVGGTLTPGFFIRGTGSKPLVIRAVGPTLRLFGVEAAIAEARLELSAQGEATNIAADARVQAVSEAAANVGAFPLEPGGKDAAVQVSLIPRGYTARVSPGSSAMAGIALAEIYDADAAAASSQLVNVSTLGFVGSGENGLTAGFVISGDAPKRLLIRGVGPGLAPFGVTGVLADPQIALVRQGATEPLVTNDNWSGDPTVRSAFETAGAFNLPAGGADAAVVVTLEPGAYTVIVSSVTAAITGQALVEIYDLDP